MKSLFQFSIRSLLIAVAFIAVGITALFNANAWWEAGLWAIVFFLLALAILQVIYRTGNERAFWTGFLVFGSFYLALFLLSKMFSQPKDIVAPLANLAYSTLLPESRRSAQLVPSNSVATIWMASPNSYSPYVVGGMPGGGMPGMPGYPMPPTVFAGPGPVSTGWAVPTPVNPSYVAPEVFLQISHALCLLIVAAIGGKAAQLIGRRTPPDASVPPVAASS